MTLLAAQSDQLTLLDKETCATVDDVDMLIYGGGNVYLLRGEKQNYEILDITPVRISNPQYIAQHQEVSLYKVDGRVRVTAEGAIVSP